MFIIFDGLFTTLNGCIVFLRREGRNRHIIAAVIVHSVGAVAIIANLNVFDSTAVNQIDIGRQQ